MININISEIFNKIIGLDLKKGLGPDGIPAYLSLSTGSFSPTGNPVSLHVCKGGDNSNIRNYSPISILSCISKSLRT